jgi:hypothetical protein
MTNRIGDAGAAALSEALKSNATLTSLSLAGNRIGDAGAAALSEALKSNATLTSLQVSSNRLGDAGAAALSEALKSNATLTTLHLEDNNVSSKDLTNLVRDRLRDNKLVLKVASWVSSAVARRVELWDDTLVIAPALAARAAVLAFGDELVDLELPDDPNLQWLSPGGRDSAAAYLLPRAEAALRQELQRLADAAKRVGEGQSSSSSVSRAL